MSRAVGPLLVLAAAAAVRAAPVPLKDVLTVTAHRPAAAAWKRTQCGSPSGSADIPSQYVMYMYYYVHERAADPPVPCWHWPGRKDEASAVVSFG